MSKLPEPTPPTESQDEDEKYSCDTSKDVRNGFICGAWTKRQEGPILNIQTMARRTLVFRCDRPDGHKGQHVDHVLGTNFMNDESMPVAAPAERVEARPMTITRRTFSDPDEVAALLDEIHKDVQGKIHDEWDWMNASFYTECLRCMVHYAREAAVAPSPAGESQEVYK